MSDSSRPALPADVAQPAGLLATLLTMSLTAIAVLRPLYLAGTDVISDFAWVQLNPAGQRMLQQPEHPTASLLTLFPAAQADGVFDKCCQAFLTGELQRHHTSYRTDGLDNFLVLVAQRYEDLLVVNFTDTSDQPRTPDEEARRARQTHEQAAHTEAARQRGELQRVFAQAPVAIAIFRGPQYVIEQINDQHLALWGRTREQVLGRPLFEAIPEAVGHGFEELLAGVVATGQPYVAQEASVRLQRHGQWEDVYFNFVYQPLCEPEGRISGVVVIANDITALVGARQQAERFNQELEVRVQERTRQLNEARLATEQQQAHLERLLHEAPAAIAVLAGPELVFELVNARYTALFPGRELPGQPILDVLPELLAGPGAALLRQVQQTGVTFEGREVRMDFARPSDGQLETRYFDFIYQARYDRSGRIDGLVLFGFEVTDKVQARQQAETLQAELLAAAAHRIQEREELYQLFEQLPASLILLRGPDHRIEYYNPAYERLFPGRQLRGRTIAESQPESTAQGFVALLDRVYRTGEAHAGIEVPYTYGAASSQPGPTIYLNFTYEPYRENGQIVGVAVFAFDVTEQVLARQEREAQRQRLNEVFEQAPVAICVFAGPSYVLEVVNPPMSEMLGHPAAQLVGRPFFEALPELVGQGLPALLAQVRQTGTPFVAQEQELHLAGHGVAGSGYYDFTYQPLRDAQGQVTAITCVATDVTEQVRARQQVQDLNEELAAINEELRASNEELGESNTQLTRINLDLDTFVYAASHDLKTPITNIEGLLDALRDYLPGEAQEPMVPRLVAMMQGAIARFQQTLGHLTDVSRLAHASAPPPEALELARILEDVRLDLLPLLESTRAELQLEVAACPPLPYAAKDLRSILFNLLSNAVKYRDPARSPLVQVRAYRTAEQRVVLEVEDNGLGLSEQQQGQLFTMFHRLHTHVEGSGVGLYLLKRLVENAGGTITVRSQPGVGSTFTVTLPHAHA